MTVSWSASRDLDFAEKLRLMKMAGSRWPAPTAFNTCILIFLASEALAAHVPVLIWSSDSLPPLASQTAGHITSRSDFSAYLSAALGSRSHTVLLFLQDKLSQDDFTVYGGVYGNHQDSAFKNLEAVLQASSSVTFPALDWSGSSAVPAMLEKILTVSPVLTAPETFPELTIDTSVNNLLLINLPYCSPDKPCREVLRNNDETVGHVLETLKSKNIPYTAIYTGLQPSRVIAQPTLSKESMGRSLLQAPSPTAGVKAPIVFSKSDNPCIMLWAQNLNINVNNTWIDLASQNFTSLTGSDCNTTNSTLVLNYPGSISLSFVMSQRFYPVSARNWFTLDFVELRWNGLTAFYTSRSIYAPAEYSYHCQSINNFQDPLLVSNTTNTNISQWRVNFVDFQIQGFGLNNGTNFSYASDCAGFFTAGIWMGLLTFLLMLFIFVYGLHMIMHLNTMDRFDDPKGPSISVPQTE